MKNHTKIVISFITATLLSSTIQADSYLELQAGKVNFNDISISDGTLYGLGLRNFYLSTGSPLIYGFEASIGANKDIGMIEAGANVGANIKLTPTNAVKLYAILGYGVQAMDDFTANGLYYGVGTTYDVTDSFAVTLNYKKHASTFESSDDDSNVKFDADVNTLLFNLAYKF